MTDCVVNTGLSPSQPTNEDSLFHSRVLAITSGKGGVGKSNVAVGLALSLAKAGQRVAIMDADFGLANVDLLLGVSPKHTLQHVLRGERVIEEIIMEGPRGVRLIPASSGIQELTKLESTTELRLIQGLQRVAVGIDWLLIDTAAGIHDSVIKILMAAQEVILVSTPEPTSLIDAYAMVKVIHLRDPLKPVWFLVNNAQSYEEAEEAADQLQAATSQFLGRDIVSLGVVPSDAHVLQAVRQQQGIVDVFPDSPAAKAFQAISNMLMEKVPLKGDAFNAFWKELGQV
ncbi:MAG: MinD/ParA family protein [Holophagales bacterium]|jgi:flagellar biosynthesis protein FlhG|nr:MinD/ParA family protein [Holophagales bacterium]